MRTTVLLVCLLAVACAPKPQPRTASPAPPAVVPDGSWHGTSTRFQADSRHCPGPSLLDFAVFNNGFDYRWTADIHVLVSVAPDGTLSGSEGDVTIKGKITGSHMEGDATSTSCGLHFTATKRS